MGINNEFIHVKQKHTENMKKLLLFVLTSLFVGGALFAQTDESGKVKNEGNAAWRAKNYKEAFTKWEQYLKLIEF